MDSNPEHAGLTAELDMECPIAGRSAPAPSRHVDSRIDRMRVAGRSSGLQKAGGHGIAAGASGKSERDAQLQQFQSTSETAEIQPTGELCIKEKISIESAQAELREVHQRCVIGARNAQSDACAVQFRRERKRTAGIAEQVKIKTGVGPRGYRGPTRRSAKECRERVGAYIEGQLPFQLQSDLSAVVDDAQIKRIAKGYRNIGPRQPGQRARHHADDVGQRCV